jgi:hypothetical protein
MKYIQFFLGVGIGIILLIAFAVWERAGNPQVQPFSRFTYEAWRSTEMVASHQGPVYTTNAWGIRVEHSQSSTEKTLTAVSNFLARVSRSGLRVSVNGPLQTQVFAGKKNIAYAYSDDTMFHAHYASDEPEAVHDMHKRGHDENGLPRNFNEVVSAAEPDLNTLAAWADPTRYPIQSSIDDIKADVIALLNQLDVGGTEKYLLESVRQELGVYKLPFYTFTFTTKENMGNGGNQNRDELEVTVRAGGTDLRKGEAELVYFTDAGFIWRKLEAQTQNAKKTALPEIKPLPAR